MRRFDTLSEQEVLALAISLEEEDERIYADFAEGLRAEYPATAKVFAGMREEESGHRRRLIELYQQKFGQHIPLIRRQDVKGFVQRRPVWLARPLRLNAIRNQAAGVAVIVVLAELATITWIRNRFMETPVFSAAMQVGLGGTLVFLTGVLIGNS
jgi:hypothetical protein